MIACVEPAIESSGALRRAGSPGTFEIIDRFAYTSHHQWEFMCEQFALPISRGGPADTQGLPDTARGLD